MNAVPGEGFGRTDDDEWMHPIEAVQWLTHSDPTRFEDIAAAECALDKWRRSGSLETLGLHAGESEPRSPSAAFWQYYWVELHDASTRYVYRNPAHPADVEFGVDGPWRNIRYRRADVLTLTEHDCISANAPTNGNAPSALPKLAVKPERRGRKPLDFWPEVNGHAAAWLAANGTPDKQADLEKVMADCIAELGEDAATSTIRRYARTLLEKFKSEMERN